MTFVLRWKFHDEIDSYYGGQADVFVCCQRDAERFETRVKAYQALDPATYHGAGGKSDNVGWVVVRLVKAKR